VIISENGRVEGLILNKTPIDDIKRTRPRSAKAGRRTASRDGRASVNTIRTFDIETINEKGVQDLFSDILYDSDEALEEYKDDFEDVDDDNNWSDDSPLPYSLSASSLTSRSDSYPYQQRPSLAHQGQYPVPESPAIVSGVKYNEWQRNSGLRVLRKVLDRQKLLEFESPSVTSSRGGGGARRKHSQVSLKKDEMKFIPKMKKKPQKLQPLNNEVSGSEEAGRRISESLMSRLSTAGV